MTKQDGLLITISALISRKAEGTYWDFKREHHKNKADLIHDILCLANAKHTGDRFLIFGVDDEDFSLYPINEDPERITQAELAGLFRDNADKFFQSRFPDFYLKEITVNETLLDVLIIEDTAYKKWTQMLGQFFRFLKCIPAIFKPLLIIHEADHSKPDPV